MPRGSRPEGGTPAKGRTTMYKGIQMRSRLEADYAAWLDQSGQDWEYEPVVFAGPGGQWLPDFRTKTLDGSGFHYTELKPLSMLALQPDETQDSYIERIDAILRRMTTAWLSEPHAGLALQFWEYGTRNAAWIGGDTHSAWRYGESSLRSHLPLKWMLWPGMGQGAELQRLAAGRCASCQAPGPAD